MFKRNERVSELWRTAAQWAHDNHVAVDQENLTKREFEQRVLMMNDKFTELMVKEFVNLLDKAQFDKGEDWECEDGTRIIHHVLDHFGGE